MDPEETLSKSGIFLMGGIWGELLRQSQIS